MNTLFWLIVAALIVLALAIVILPLFKNSTLDTDSHQRRNIAIARQRLAELKQQLQDGALSQAEFDEQYLELQLMLQDDLQEYPETAAAPRRGRWIAIMLLTLIPGISLLVYQLLGDPNALAKAEMQANQSKAVANIADMVGKLEQRLKATPDDAEGWLMLGRSYGYMQQYQKAAEAYAQLYRLQPDDIEAMLQYANNLAMARNGRMAGEPAQLIAKVLQRDTNNANALWLAGMARVEEGAYAEAKAHWQKLLTLLPADSGSRPQVQQMLAALEQEMAKGEVAPSVEINVNVDLAAEVKAKSPAEASVFVYAQAIDGSKMPLAIVRKRLADLPGQVTLSDAQAMQPGIKLADQTRLKIVARVSQSGEAMPRAGDWLGSIELEAPFDKQTANLLINQEVK
ncbi:MAG: c-type cytochrome biogenesis protein CcmI [Methylomonas sp.]|nr:c-type cytochrome biogenesis protein CcmI [Methylomonas sp.]